MFRGFQPLSANFVYCPNQFFDVCLPHYSRGVIRLVAYLLRRTLGWLDENGNPIEQDITVSYQDLIRHARMSRGTIAQTVGEAIAGGFIVCRKPPCSKAAGRPAQSAQYALRWGYDNRYTTDPSGFAGFYAGEGNRTPIPNAFFDHVVPYETATVVKVVGTVIRHTVGYQTQFGRRPQAELSYRFIQEYAKIADRSTLSAAIQHSIDTGYIHRVQDGCFSPISSKRQAASYSIRWLKKAKKSDNGTITRPIKSNRFKNQTSIGSKNQPDDRFKNQTNRKTEENNTYKQQHKPVVVENKNSYEQLIKVGFDPRVAQSLTEKRTHLEIQQQIDWLEHRKPRDNKLGMLRRSIEQNWSAPETVKHIEKQKAIRSSQQQEHLKQLAEDNRTIQKKRQRNKRKQDLLDRWQNLPHDQRTQYLQTAVDQAVSDFDRRRLRRADIENPPLTILELMARGE